MRAALITNAAGQFAPTTSRSGSSRSTRLCRTRSRLRCSIPSLLRSPLSGLPVCCARTQSRSSRVAENYRQRSQRLEQEAARLVEAMADGLGGLQNYSTRRCRRGRASSMRLGGNSRRWPEIALCRLSKALEADLANRVEHWRGLLTLEVPQARQIAQEVTPVAVAIHAAWRAAQRLLRVRRTSRARSASVRRCGLSKYGWRPHRDSNPGFSLERAAS